nr:hypothetical protein [uncultured bacterium]
MRLRAGVASTSSAGPNQLTLSVHGVVSVTLEPIEVRRHAMPGRETERHHADGEWPEPLDDEALREPDEVFDVGAPETASDVAEGWPDEEWDEDTADEEPEEEPILQPLQGSLLSSVDGEHRNGTRPLAARAPFKVRCFGSFEVTRASGERLNWRIQKARELLAYLIARGDEAVMREEVAEALWPDGLPEQLDRLLSNAAYQLRQAFKGSGEGDLRVLEVAAQRYRLRRELFQVDMEAFLAHIKRAEDLDAADSLAEYTRALEIYQADFLAKEPFDWASPYRLDLQKRFLAAAHRAAKAAFDCRDTSQALQFYRAVLDRDPLDEEAARGSMRCYAKLADTNGVRKVYKVLKEALRRELEDEKAEPLPETRTLFEELSRVRN